MGRTSGIFCRYFGLQFRMISMKLGSRLSNLHSDRHSLELVRPRFISGIRISRAFAFLNKFLDKSTFQVVHYIYFRSRIS
jgi:hypothetical protein